MRRFQYPNDPQDAKCPHCEESGKPCSHIDSLTRAYARGICQHKYNKKTGK